jgi:hypothetical protein
MGLRHAALALLFHSSKPVTLNTLQVESMQVRQINNVVGTILDNLGIYWPEGEDVSGHKAYDLLLNPDPTINLHKPEL